MNKRIGVYSVLALLLLSVTASLVLAQQTAGASTAVCTGKTGFDYVQCYVTSFVSPIGFEDQWTGLVIGILAIIVLFVIILDIAQLALPFSNWVNWIIAIAFVIVAGLLGLIRTINGWALTFGSYLVGGAGALAIIMSAVLLVIVIIALFFGGEKLRNWIVNVKGKRTIMEAKAKGYKAAEDVVAASTYLRNLKPGMNS